MGNVTMAKISAFLPCRKGSERVPRKNIRPFHAFQHGLIEIKLRQLLAVNLIDEVVLSTNDDEILEFARTLDHSKLRLHKRADALSSSSTSTDDLVGHAVELIPDGHILWTHVTSPFVNAEEYTLIIQRYMKALEGGFDSLMTTSAIHGFLWNDTAPLNYDRTVEKWPRTQTLDVVHEVNSAAFLNSADNYRQLKDRIGTNPFLYAMGKIQGFDIDWEDDFAMAQCIVSADIAKL
jgi:CMP-N-acetylneuraminic acid synthetase